VDEETRVTRIVVKKRTGDFGVPQNGIVGLHGLFVAGALARGSSLALLRVNERQFSTVAIRSIAWVLLLDPSH
jgi:hypothetical protein